MVVETIDVYTILKKARGVEPFGTGHYIIH